MGLRRVVEASALIQIAGAIPLIWQNLFAPLWYGREAFGAATAAMALPYLLQGITEPIVISLWLRSGDGAGAAMLRLRLVRDLFHVCVLGLVALGGLWIMRSAAPELGTLALWAATAVAFPLLMLSTVVVALVYDRHRYRQLAAALLVYGATMIVGFVTLRWAGAAGMVLAIAASQLAFQVALFQETRRALHWLVAAMVLASRENGPSATRRPWGQYLGAFAAKAGVLWLNAGVLFCATFLLSTNEIAHFKLAQTLAFASLRAIPASPYVLQSSARHPGGVGDPLDGKYTEHIVRGLIALLAWSVGLSVVLWLTMPWFHALFLGRDNTGAYRHIAFAVPGIMTVTVLGAMLLARSADASLYRGTVAGIALSVAFLVFKKVGAAVIGGATAMGLCYAVSILLLKDSSPEGRRERAFPKKE